jgi:hypothetical protein
MCKKYAEDAQKLREEKTKLEGMVESRNELISEIVDKYGYNHNDEDADDEDDDNEGNATIPPAAAPPAGVPEVITVNKEDPVEMVPEQEAHEVHEVILVDVEPVLPHPRLFNVITRDYEESPSRILDGPHE